MLYFYVHKTLQQCGVETCHWFEKFSLKTACHVDVVLLKLF